MGKAARVKAERKQRVRPVTQRDVGHDKVCVAYVNPAEVSAYFMQSMVGLLFREHMKSDAGQPSTLFAEHDERGNLIAAGGYINKFSSANISNSRNDVVRDFLKLQGKPEWLWFVDADMQFEPDTIDRLLASANADPESENYAPIVGGLCFGVSNGKLFPTTYGLKETDEGIRAVRFDEYPHEYVGAGPACDWCETPGAEHSPPPGEPGAMFQVAATGAACLLIHRSVLEAMEAREFNKVYPWFQETELNGRPCGEDFTFCLRAGVLGFPVWVDTGVKIGHQKTQILSEPMYVEQAIRDRTLEAEKEAT